MFYILNDSFSKFVFISSFFQMELLLCYQCKVLNIFEFFVVFVLFCVFVVISINSMLCRIFLKELQFFFSLEEFFFYGLESGGWLEEEKLLGVEIFVVFVFKKVVFEDVKLVFEVFGIVECSKGLFQELGVYLEEKKILESFLSF